MTLRPATASCSARGSVLLLVLWLMIIMGVIGLSYMGSVRTQLAVARQRDGRQQAAWAARAGVEQARAILQETDLDKTDQVELLWDDEERCHDQEIGVAKFSLMGSPDPKTGAPRFGLTDEAARLNINVADEQMLTQVEGLSDEQIQSLLDWVDTDQAAHPEGAENDYYMKLKEPYTARDGALKTVRELMRVRGWAEVFQAAWPEPWQRFEKEAEKPAMDQESARKLLDELTVWSQHDTKAPDGQDQLKLASATEDQMKQRIKDLKDNEAKAIVAYRQNKRFNSPVDLLEVTEAQNQQSSQGGQGGQGGGGNSSSQSQSSGKKIFDLKRVGQIIDYFSAQGDGATEGQPGGINLNTASEEVLKALPSMTDALLGAIRQTARGRPILREGGRAGRAGRDERRDFQENVSASRHPLAPVSRGVARGGGRIQSSGDGRGCFGHRR